MLRGRCDCVGNRWARRIEAALMPGHRRGPEENMMNNRQIEVLLLLAVLPLLAALPVAVRAQQAIVTQTSPTRPGLALGVLGEVTRLGGSAEAQQDFTVAAQLTARNGKDVNQTAVGVAAEAWALPGSRSNLVGFEASVINQEPGNHELKVAASVMFKNRADGAPDPNAWMNQNSIAVRVSAQPGTGFERGVVFAPHSLVAAKQRPAVLDLSELSDEEIGGVDLIRIRKGVALRYDPQTGQLVLAVAPVPL
jgi:hypothetical protein